MQARFISDPQLVPGIIHQMKNKFCTILNSLKSPQNVGLIVRSHVANGGSELILTGQELPWRFKKGTQAFSRKLEKLCNIKHIPDQFDSLNWCKEKGYSPVAIEIQRNSIFLDEFSFPNRTAIIVGNEGSGLDQKFLKACDHVVTIKQIGEVGSLNVAVSASLAMYEFNRYSNSMNNIIGNKYKEIRA